MTFSILGVGGVALGPHPLGRGRHPQDASDHLTPRVVGDRDKTYADHILRALSLGMLYQARLIHVLWYTADLINTNRCERRKKLLIRMFPTTPHPPAVYLITPQKDPNKHSDGYRMISRLCH